MGAGDQLAQAALLANDLRVDQRGGADDVLRAHHLAANGKFVAMIVLQLAEQVGAEADLHAGAAGDLERTQPRVQHQLVLRQADIQLYIAIGKLLPKPIDFRLQLAIRGFESRRRRDKLRECVRQNTRFMGRRHACSRFSHSVACMAMWLGKAGISKDGMRTRQHLPIN